MNFQTTVFNVTVLYLKLLKPISVYILPTVSAHNLHNKCPLMRICGTCNSIHSFNNPIGIKITKKTHKKLHKIYLCKALSVPIVISVPQKSLSIEPTRPAILNE